MVSGCIKLAAEVMVPLVEEKAIVLPAGMALPFTSTTVTANVVGTSPLTTLHAGIVMGAPPLMVMFAYELESIITWESRTWRV